MSFFDDFCAAAMESASTTSKMPKSVKHSSMEKLPDFTDATKLLEYIRTEVPKGADTSYRQGSYKGYGFATDAKRLPTPDQVEWVYNQIPSAYSSAIQLMTSLAPEWAPDSNPKTIESQMSVQVFTVDQGHGSTDVYGELYVNLPDDFGGHCIVVSINRKDGKPQIKPNLAG